MRSVMARTGRLPRVAREAVQALGLGSPRPLPDERRPDMLAPLPLPQDAAARLACGRPRTRCQAGGTSLILANGWQVEVLSGRGGKQPAAILIDTGTQRVLLDAGASLETAHDDGADAWLGRALAKGLDAVLILSLIHI